MKLTAVAAPDIPTPEIVEGCFDGSAHLDRHRQSDGSVKARSGCGRGEVHQLIVCSDRAITSFLAQSEQTGSACEVRMYGQRMWRQTHG